MAKYCGICNRKTGLLEPVVKMTDGCICLKCVKLFGVKDVIHHSPLSVQEGTEILKNRKYLITCFNPADPDSGSACIRVDDALKAFEFEGVIYPYSSLKTFKYKEDYRVDDSDKDDLKVKVDICIKLRIDDIFKGGTIEKEIVLADRINPNKKHFREALLKANACLKVLCDIKVTPESFNDVFRPNAGFIASED